MRVVIDALGVVPFGGYAVALEAILAGWEELDTDDELHLLMSEGVELEIPDSVEIHRFRVGRPAALRRVAVQTRAARRVCRETDADALLGVLPTTAVGPVGCPKVIMVYDMRHELLPEQFTRGRRLLRRVGYELGYRQAAAIICISERTRRDLLRSRPWLAEKPVVAVLWAADHVDSWPRRDPRESGDAYALAFGHFPNKAVERVIDTWEVLRRRGDERRLVFVGLPGSARAAVAERIRSAGLDDLVTPMPWLEREEFEATFASAGLIVFPSDFEGFGLPAVEAMRLGIPLVISTDEALLEVTGGHATVVDGTDAESLAEAVTRAWATPPEELERARGFVGGYSWAKTARETREVLLAAAEGEAPER
jgi:glycosyltransferase involved in cell wall biosynthesis